MNSIDFVDKLLAEIDSIRLEQKQILAGESKNLPDAVIKHWLNFAVYYERAAVSFIGGWLATTDDNDALMYFSHQIEDECNHYRWLLKHLQEYSTNLNEFSPPTEWRFLMEEYYPNLKSLIERLAAHNLASETGAIGFMEFNLDKFPEAIRHTVTKVLKDERYHASFGIKLLKQYCINKKTQDKARKAALDSMMYMAKAREVFVNI